MSVATEKNSAAAKIQLNKSPTLQAHLISFWIALLISTPTLGIITYILTRFISKPSNRTH